MTATSARLLRKYNIPGPRYTATHGTLLGSHADRGRVDRPRRRCNRCDTARAGASLYIHIPFCRSLCTYCGCNMRVTRNHGLVMPYVESILAEYGMYCSASDSSAAPWRDSSRRRHADLPAR